MERNGFEIERHFGGHVVRVTAEKQEEQDLFIIVCYCDDVLVDATRCVDVWEEATSMIAAALMDAMDLADDPVV